ncbi:glycosyltransferase family 1 protein [Jeotgalibacillus marinus]|uniref:Glycosyltransferase family 1 protein n=1 Tax=Jeotgalibacillus marinus TaxID=86667 RepID=A0ABV3Q1V6_9BACL
MNQTKPVKVLQVVGAMNRAGTETMLMNVYRGIDKNKIQFDFVSYSKEESHYDDEIKSYGGKIIKLSNTWSIKEMVGKINMHGPYDAVHSHTLFNCGIANTAAQIAGVKIRIAHAHTTNDSSDSLIRKIYLKCMRKMILHSSTHLLACSKGAGHYLFGEKGVQNENYSYFPNAIDYSPFLQQDNNSEARKFKMQCGFGNNLVIGHIGRFIKAKNHLFLLRIMQCLLEKDPSVKLLLVGEGEEKKRIINEVKKVGLEKNVVFAGIRTDIPVMLQCMDAFVFPSIYEGLGLVLLEAQASGMPCIVSEAIQPEADLELGLISKQSLDEHPRIWANRIMEVVGKKEKDFLKITRAFEEKNYAVSVSIAKLMSLYSATSGGTDENYTDRLI